MIEYNHNYYNKNLSDYAKRNRKNPTPSELRLWRRLRGKQLLGLKFLRQRAIDMYIVDFLQPNTKLIVEIDGFSHDDKKFEYDQLRENRLKSLGFKILRFSEYEVKKSTNDVVSTITFILQQLISTPPAPSQEGE